MEYIKEVRNCALSVLKLINNDGYKYANKITGRLIEDGFLNSYPKIVLWGLRELGYIKTNKQSELELTSKGKRIVCNDKIMQTLANVPWIIPDIRQPDWDGAFRHLLREGKKTVAKNIEKEILDENAESLKAMIASLDDKARYAFYVKMQDTMELGAIKAVDESIDINMPVRKYNVTFHGYTRDKDIESLPDCKGVFMVYKHMTYGNSQLTWKREIIHIGKATQKGIRETIKDVCKNINFKDEILSFDELCYSWAELSERKINIVENALLNRQKPNLNDKSTFDFRYDIASFEFSGDCDGLKSKSFTISRNKE